MGILQIRANQLTLAQMHTKNAAIQWLRTHTSGHLSSDARRIQLGDAFLAYAFDANNDGRLYIEQAVNHQTSAVLWQDDGTPIHCATNHIGISELNVLAGHIAHDYYQKPSSTMNMIAITGTNGKTSCAQWVAQMLDALEQKCALIGTLGAGFVSAMVETGFTTPQAVEVHRLLSDLHAQGADATVMEVSSHALEQGRVNGVDFDVALFTNLSRDHLDYHGDMATYEAAKTRLFTWQGLKTAVINTDDEAGRRMAEVAMQNGITVIGYGLSVQPKGVDIYLQASNILMHSAHTQFTLNTNGTDFSVTSGLVGTFNVMNLLGVLGVLHSLGFAWPRLLELCTHISAAPGRMQRVGGDNQPLVVIDFAHTPDALEKTLHALKPIAQQREGQLICVFGCGGDRDAGKRAQMGAVSVQSSDQVWLTSDNPRSENPSDIVTQIAQGTKNVKHHVHVEIEIERQTAIARAIESAQCNDVVLIAGKGHESYQEIKGMKHPYSDLTEVELALSQWNTKV